MGGRDRLNHHSHRPAPHQKIKLSYYNLFYMFSIINKNFRWSEPPIYIHLNLTMIKIVCFRAF